MTARSTETGAYRPDGLHDPLTATHPGRDLAHVPSYWQATAGPPPETDGPLTGDRDCDIAIVGGGYTGLSCATFLGHRHGIRAVVLESNRPGWGCSGRNGSFARPAIGRLPYADWVSTWGEAAARALFREALEALGTVRGLIADHRIDCDVQPDGWLKIAHRPGRFRQLEQERRVLREQFDFEAELLDRDRLAAEHVRGGEGYGALRWPLSFAMHPLKLSHGLARAARTGGARLHCASPVLEWRKRDGRHELRTPGGTLRAGTVVVATNGYTLERLFSRFRGRLLPVLSNIVVTQPLSAEQKAAGNFVTSDVMTDTRGMLYYFRRLPDDRIMLGGKGPLRQDPAAMLASQRQLLRAVAAKFPFLPEPRAEFFWGGWVALTRDFIPHVARAEDDASILYALGYMGSGVSMSCHAGRRLAESLAGEALELPAPLTAPLPKFPFAAFRRLGQMLMMRRYRWLDRRD